MGSWLGDVDEGSFPTGRRQLPGQRLSCWPFGLVPLSPSNDRRSYPQARAAETDGCASAL
eukprot:15118776-Alexandrium_andersonii.AAC.1